LNWSKLTKPSFAFSQFISSTSMPNLIILRYLAFKNWSGFSSSLCATNLLNSSNVIVLVLSTSISLNHLLQSLVGPYYWKIITLSSICDACLVNMQFESKLGVGVSRSLNGFCNISLQFKSLVLGSDDIISSGNLRLLFLRWPVDLDLLLLLDIPALERGDLDLMSLANIRACRSCNVFWLVTLLR